MRKRTPTTVLDEYLVAQSQRGDSGAFQSLVERWHPRLLGLAFGYTKDAEAAQDVAQDGWLAIVRGIVSLHDPARFRPWAYRIVANKARDWVRRERSRRRVTQRPDVSNAGPEPDSRAAAVARVRAGIERLDPEQRLILSWFYIEEMSVRDIAEALSIPSGTVKSRLFHARIALRDCLKEE